MEKNFTRRRDSSRTRDEEIYIIPDSDEDTDEEIENKEKNNEFFIDDSSDVNASGEATPTRCFSSKDLFRIRKYVYDDSAKEKEEDSEQDDVNEEGSSKSEELMAEASTRNNYDPDQISLSSDSESSSEMLSMSYAFKEIGNGNANPLVAQKRALNVCKLEHMESQLSKLKLLLGSNNIDFLPDKGEKLRESVARQEKEIQKLKAELKNIPLTNPKTEQYSTDKFNWDNMSLELPLSSDEKQRGKKAQETLERESALTADRLEDLHGSLVARPNEDEKAEDPRGLKVPLMPHQQHALAWLIWREQQRPAGGILADDMGLGKTLTMIALIMASIAKRQSSTDDDDEDSNTNKKLNPKAGTLIICPASLLGQWETEIKNRCRRGMLSVQVYHGANRETQPKRLAKNDVVITTYMLLRGEFKSNSTIFKVKWERVILDEAHVIRNHKSQTCEAVCGLSASKRWALTGTPIQNKEFDLYSILKFLKCSPFDDLRVWKRWVDNKNVAGRQRLITLMKALMLRRTKQELQEKGALDSLPEKFVEEIWVDLYKEEQLVYEKVLIYSRTLFAQFLKQKADKEHMDDLTGGRYNAPSFRSNPNQKTAFTKAQNKLLASHADVKTHEILLLLLRLRQICVHPSLIQAMLDQDDMKESGVGDTENLDPNLLSRMNNITLQDETENDTEEEDIGIDQRVIKDLLTLENPVFDPDRTSSKVKMVLDKIREVLKQNDKVVVVSQWSSVLKVIASRLSSIQGATYDMFTGDVPIKHRQNIVDSFNAPDSNPKILLLSLTAGGVGLNLVGGNHLLFIDNHWNPQLEVQAQDRIFRFGQKKNVFIYKFICKNTIEERIKSLQENKLTIAENVLSGQKSIASKLTLQDIKSLFDL